MYKAGSVSYHVFKPNVLQKMRNNAFCRTELKYFYNAEYRSL